MKTSTFLTFVGNQCGKAVEAIRFYTSVIPNSEIKMLIKYDEGEVGGTSELIKFGVFTLTGQEGVAPRWSIIMRMKVATCL